MKLLNHPVTLAFGLTTLCLLFLIGPFVSPNHSTIYHLTGPAKPLFVSAGIYFCYLWLVIAGILGMAEKYPKAWLPVWLGVILFLPWILLKNAVTLESLVLPHRAMVFLFLLTFVAFMGLVLFRPSILESTFPAAQRFASVLLGCAAFAGLSLSIQFLNCAWEARDLNPPFVRSPRTISPSNAAPRPKVIWILLDELSYQQVYGQRYPGLNLPAFDQLASQSVVFTQVVPAGVATEDVVPSLFTGLPVDRIRVSADGHLRSLRNPVTGAWQPFSQYQTVFQDGRSAGYATGIAGWFNPYCRILPEVLDRCSWTYRDSVEINLRYLRRDRTWRARITSPFRFIASYLRSALRLGAKGIRPDSVDPEMHIGDYEEIRDAGDKLLADPSIDFVFLHLPVPHPGGIYDRRRMTFVTSGSSYLDNLVLADHYLAHVRQELVEQRQWDSSVVIVMGDHSWRTTLFWRDSPGWTPEEEQASHGGRFDDRPGYIVKMPQQETGVWLDTPFRAIDTRALLDEIISNRLQTGQDLQSWAEKRH